jgi:hypothetical protein
LHLWIASADTNQLSAGILGQTKLSATWTSSSGRAFLNALVTRWLNNELVQPFARASRNTVSRTGLSSLGAVIHSTWRSSGRTKELFVGIPAVLAKSNLKIVHFVMNSISNINPTLIVEGIVQLGNPEHIGLVN